MRVVVTGGAGFIGSNVVDALVARGDSVTVLDNLSTGHIENLNESRDHCDLVQLDLVKDKAQLAEHIAGTDAVIHLAANADVRFGWDDTRRDLDQNIVATLNILDAMRDTGVRRILFSSTGSVYGEAAQIPTPENTAFPIQTSLYGASKVAAEGYIAAYAENNLISGTVFRFVSILGARYSHGHVIDFYEQLQKDPTTLRILGDGTQRKSYLDVSDCVKAVLNRLDNEPKFEVLNLGVDTYCTVTDSIGWICERLGLQPKLEYTGGDRGWVGDNPFIQLDTQAMRCLGWTPKYTIREAVERTVDYLAANQAAQ